MLAPSGPKIFGGKSMANLNAAVDDEPEDPVDPIGEEADRGATRDERV